ncbi:MAG: hypothetical protein J6S89_10100 [Paludibacteraceae bacterium]|nr:hypothetical protein [Paludibacteraceae bacterium]
MDINKLIDVAIAAAKEAGNHLASFHNTMVDREEGHDIKLRADKEAERIILDKLIPTGITILSEECGLLPAGDSSYYWIVDPLDGSLNYLHGLPISCVSIALWQGEDTPIMGVIYDFNHNKLYKGIVSAGATCNDEPIHVSMTSDKSRAIITTGFPVYLKHDDISLASFIRTLQEYKKVRLIGSAALSCAMVAQGSVESYHERSIAWWDVAAGIAITIAAGGCADVEILNKEKHLLDVFLSNGLIKKD